MPVIDKYKQIQENIQLKKNTPLQDKVDEIQKKVDEQNRQKALQNVANVQNKTELANADNLVKRTGMTTMYNTSSNPPQTPWQQVAAQNLQNKGIDPTKLGTGTGESYQPYTPTTQPTEPVTPTTTTVTPLQQKVDAIQKQVDANNEAIKQWQVSPIQQKLEQDKLNRINSKVSLYSNGESLYNAVQGGSILPWTQEWTTLAQTKPEIIQQYDVIKKQKDNYNQVKVLGEAIVWDVQPPQPSNALQNLLAYFQKDLSTDIAWEYQNTVINNPAYQGSVQKFNDINQQIADNNKNIQALRDDVRKKYSAWTPESLIASAIAREARPLIEQGQYLSQLQANAESEMTRILEENKSVFEMKQQERTQKNQRMMELYGTIRSEEIRQEDMARADKLLADEIARTDKKDKEKLAQLEQERLDNVKTAIAQLGVEPKWETYDELLGEYATAVKNQPKEDKIITGLTPWQTIYKNWEFITVPWGEATTTIDFIKSKEWFRENAYLDSGGVPTIGYWFTNINGKPVKIGDTMTREQADKELQNQIDSKYSNWKNLVSVNLSPSQEAALTSLEYNLGGGVWGFPNWKQIIEAINNEDFGKASSILANSGIGTTVKSTGQVLPWLVKRRREEAQLLLNTWEQELSTSDVATFNNSTYKPQTEKDPEMKRKYQQFLETKNWIMWQKDANINDVMAYSQWGKDLTDTDTKALTKFSQALDQITGIQKQIKDIQTGPVLWKLKQLNPYDTDAQVLTASLNALIPNLARGVYGEVGVLTDNDIRQYSKTIPNLTQTNDVNNAVLALTLDTIAWGYKRQLQTLAAAWKDVSWFSGIYESLKAQSDSIKSQIPWFSDKGTAKKNIFTSWGSVGWEATVDSNTIF